MGAGGKRFQCPGVGEDPSAAQRERGPLGSLERREGWRDELPGLAEPLHGAVAGAGWYQHHRARAARKRELGRFYRPLQARLPVKEGGIHQDEHTQRDALGGEESGGTRELGEVEPLVQPFQHLGVRGLEPQRHLQRSGQQVAQDSGAIADKQRMRFHDDVACERYPLRDRRIVGRRDRPGIEEAAAVVELYLHRKGPRIRPCPNRKLHLARNRPLRDGIAGGVLPQVAHQAAPGAFSVGQQHDAGIDDGAGRQALPFEKDATGRIRIGRGGRRRTLREDPCSAAPRWIRRGHAPY